MLIDGKKISEKILGRVKTELEQDYKQLKLAGIMVDDNEVSESYLKKKQEACEKVGIKFELIQFSSKLNQEELENKIQKLAEDKNTSGIIIQLPLPHKFNPQEILNLIPKEKDVDVLSEAALGNYYTATSSVMPPTVKAVTEILNEYRVEVKGTNVVLVGTGALVGYPLSLWLHRQKATVIAVNEFTSEPIEILRSANVIISGVGIPGTVTKEMISENAVVIDAGTSFVEGKMKGDVDFEKVSKKARLITPVPGGVGPVTVACLLENLVILNKHQ